MKGLRGRRADVPHEADRQAAEPEVKLRGKARQRVGRLDVGEVVGNEDAARPPGHGTAPLGEHRSGQGEQRDSDDGSDDGDTCESSWRVGLPGRRQAALTVISIERDPEMLPPSPAP